MQHKEGLGIMGMAECGGGAYQYAIVQVYGDDCSIVQ